MNFFQITGGQPTLQPEIIFYIGSWPVTGTLMMIWLVILVTIFFLLAIKKFHLKPRGKFQHIIEMIYETMLAFIDKLTGDQEISKKIFPLIGALFFFIGISNLIGLVPVVNSFSYQGVPLLRTPTNDFNTTFSLALSMIILIQLVSIKEWGFFGHLGKYFKFKEIFLGFKKGIGPGFMSIIDFIIGLMDIITEIARVISLSMRLFGNMYAGEFLTVILMGIFAYFLPATWLLMSLLAAVVQALVFGSLTTMYYVMALNNNKKIEQEKY